MPYLVTGATGFIGSYVVRNLMEAGEGFVAFDRSPKGALPMVLGPRASSVQVEVGDVADLAHILRVVKEHKIDRIIHLAAELHLASAANPWRCIQSNIMGEYNVLEASRLFDVLKVVRVSSASLFGTVDKHPSGSLRNDARHYPHGIYEASKEFGELLGAFYSETYGVDTVDLRLGLVYGYGVLDGIGWRIVNELVIKPAQGLPGRVPWGDELINWTYAKDAANALVCACKAPRSSTYAYNVRGDPRRIRDAVEITRALIPGADVGADAGQNGWAQDFDDAMFRSDTGFRSAYTLEDGLRDTMMMVRAHGTENS